MNQIYDYVIIGNDIGSLALATALSKHTKSVALIDGSEAPGSDCKSVSFPNGTIANGLHFVPDTELARKALLFLEEISERKILGPSREVPPVTFEQGQLKEFLGFGEAQPKFYEDIRFFTSPKRLELLLPVQDWGQALLQNFQGEFIPRSYVTKMEMADGKITGLTINGSKTIKGLNFIYCGPSKALVSLLPEHALNHKVRQRLSNRDQWSALYLDLCHEKTLTENTAVHILSGTNVDELEPCCGQFGSPNSDGMQVSQWVIFIENDLDDDGEAVVQSLKKMKKQIKRAYPSALTDLKAERVRWSPLPFSQSDLKLSGRQTLGEIDNLWIASGAANPQKFWIGSLLQAEMVLAATGFQVPMEIPTSPELS